MKIQDIILETKKTKWSELKDLQPINLKVNYHSNKIKQSIIENGFARAIYVWIDPVDQLTYIVDGHCRVDLLNELLNEGYNIPEYLNCTYLDNTIIITKKQAIKYLLNVFNVKTNPINEEVVIEWLEEENIILGEENIVLENLDIKIEDNNNIEFKQSDQNREIDIDNMDISECKIIFKFDALMYESVLNRMNKLKQEKNIQTNELLLLNLLEHV